ncbi:MAG TPA: hypothetical protein VID05_05330, partial [Acidimicrobiales bacterium]
MLLSATGAACTSRGFRLDGEGLRRVQPTGMVPQQRHCEGGSSLEEGEELGGTENEKRHRRRRGDRRESISLTEEPDLTEGLPGAQSVKRSSLDRHGRV